VSARRRDLGGEGVPGLDWTAGFSVKQNLYAGGADVARKLQADQRAVESRLAEDKLRRQLERAFAQAMADVNNSAAAVAARKEAAQVAAVALEAVREQFAFRRGTLLDLLRAQEELYAAGRDLIDGIVDESLVRYRLLDLAMELTPLFGIPLTGAAPAN
jgi:adhesin transport system outer membrane protein